MEKICKNIIKELNRKNIIQRNETQIYEYALKILCYTSINIITIILIGIISGMLYESLLLLASFFSIRSFAGGIHANKYIHCYMFSVILIFLVIISIKYLLVYLNPLFIVFTEIISIILIFILSPLENNNKKLNKKEKIVYKCVSLLLSILFFVVSICVIKTNLLKFLSIACGVNLASILLFVGYLKRLLFLNKLN